MTKGGNKGENGEKLCVGREKIVSAGKDGLQKDNTLFIMCAVTKQTKNFFKKWGTFLWGSPSKHPDAPERARTQ